MSSDQPSSTPAGSKPMKWFRFYSEALDDPKVQRLPGDLFKMWVNLLCLANRSTPRGVLPPLADIAFALRMSEHDASAALKELDRLGLFDEDDEQRHTPHNWEGRQQKSDDVTARVTAHRQRAQQPSYKNETLQPATDVTFHETLHVTDQNRIDKNRVDLTPYSPPVETKPDETAGRRTTKGKTALPADFSVTEAMHDWATLECGLTAEMVRHQTEKFKSSALAHDRRYSNWPQAWRQWILNMDQYDKPATTTSSRNGYTELAAPQRGMNVEQTKAYTDELRALRQAKLDREARAGPSPPAS